MNYPYNNCFPTSDVGGMVWINDKRELNNVTVLPNHQKVFFLRSADQPVFYVVSANEIGMTSVTTYEFKEVVEVKPDDKYVTKAEFQKLIEMLGGANNEPTLSKNI